MKSQYVNIQKPRRKGPVAAWPEEYCHLSSRHLGDRNRLHTFQTNSVKIHKFYFIGYSLPSYPEVCMSGWGELWWLTGFRSFLNLPYFLTLLMFLLIDMLIISSSRNKAHHNSTFHIVRQSQVNRSALVRKNHAENDGGWETIWLLAEDLKSMWKQRNIGKVVSFLTPGQDWVRSKNWPFLRAQTLSGLWLWHRSGTYRPLS